MQRNAPGATRGYEAEKTTLQEDKFAGIDYWLTKADKQTSIQIKCCRQISRYNNFYMQTSKCIGDAEKGKAVKANRFLYFDVVNRKMYDMATKEIQESWDDIVANSRYHEKAQVNGSVTKSAGGKTQRFCPNIECSPRRVQIVLRLNELRCQ